MEKNYLFKTQPYPMFHKIRNNLIYLSFITLSSDPYILYKVVALTSA
jgi:hypothetical protein